ncbi:alpha/beta fold hydrolase [Citricoccus zhacaiensis]
MVAPSLPGFGVSFRPGQPRLSIAEIADLFAELMSDVLGYEAFGAQGGDWGSQISSSLAVRHAERLTGVHLNLLTIPSEAIAAGDATEEECQYLEEAVNGSSHLSVESCSRVDLGASACPPEAPSQDT